MNLGSNERNLFKQVWDFSRRIHSPAEKQVWDFSRRIHSPAEKQKMMFGTQLLQKGARPYPDRLATCLGDAAPDQLSVIGQGEPPLAGSLALLCSAKAPAGVLLAVHDLAQQWRYSAQTIISGFHAPVEQEAFTVLLRGPGRVVYCPARGLPRRLPAEWQTPLAEGRLTLLSPFADTVRRGTKATAVYRNHIVAALADVVLIAYAHPDSSSAHLAQAALTWGKPVYTLPHPANDHLRRLGLANLPP
jgi:predicted Rossmann fold nucleotide-binding protein DprA/Smf involved in DNA uptake